MSLDPLGPILGVLFEDGSSDYVLRVLKLVGIPAEFQLTSEESYSHMDFSPGDGSLLASVGGSPDFMLTVWDWRKEKVLLRSKAFSQDIYRVTFSPVIPGQLTTSGTGHIRFWKMANTFTGLKLQGQLGKFGRTELSDISGRGQ